MPDSCPLSVVFNPGRSCHSCHSRRSTNSECPPQRKRDAKVASGGVGIRRLAVEREEEIGRRVQILPDVASEAAIKLKALPAPVAEARVVLKGQINLCFWSVV